MSGHSILAAVIDVLLKPADAILSGGERIFWMYLVSALVLAIVVYVRREQTRSVMAFVGYVFPKEVYRHKSSLADYQFLVIAFFVLGVMAPAVGAISHAISSQVQSSIGRTGVPLVHVGAVLGTIVYTLWLALTLDFSLFLGHWLEHFVPWLWEFHKTHHSAEQLNPITVYRMHPLDTLFTFVVTGVLLGVSDGLFQSFVRGNYAEVIVFNLNIAFFAFYLVGYNLRHTHVWLHYGPRWSRVFVSPALHQIHHSVDERHHNKNMGFLFSFWDAMFGTLYVPEKFEAIEFGINREGEHTEYHSVWALLMKPFNKIGIPSVVVIVLIVIGTAAWLDFRLAPPGWLAKHDDEKVALADLTSPELREKIATGYTTVIVPAGGFEQGGPHLVLGKHNFVVQYTADQIAR
ncbi:MAG: sterol desaturase family protein, partial [Polyangiaceae bacterium]